MEKLQNSISQTAPVMPSTGVPLAPETIKEEAFYAAKTGDTDALVLLLDEYQFDLSTVEEHEGQTVLHQAIAGGHDAMVKTLLGRAGNDPRILDAKDRDGYTPLMRATETGNVPLMQALVEVGARTDDSVDLNSLTQLSPFYSYVGPLAERLTIAAQMLIEARGDISEAFELAIKYGRKDAQQLYFNAGARTVLAMQRLPFPEVIGHLVNSEYIRADDVFIVLEQAERTGNSAMLKRLAQHDVVRCVLDDMKGRSDSEKITALRRLMAVEGAQPELWLKLAVPAYKRLRVGIGQQRKERFERPLFDRLRLLIASGVDSRQLLVSQCHFSTEPLLQKMIEWGGDALGAWKIMRERDPQCLRDNPTANVLAYAELKDILYAKNLSTEEKRAALKALVLEGAEPAASALMRDIAKTSRSLDDMKLLLSVGASGTGALMELGKSHSRGTAQQLIRLGVDPAPAMRGLLDTGEQDAANVLAVAVATEYVPAGPSNPAKS